MAKFDFSDSGSQARQSKVHQWLQTPLLWQLWQFVVVGRGRGRGGRASVSTAEPSASSSGFAGGTAEPANPGKKQAAKAALKKNVQFQSWSRSNKETGPKRERSGSSNARKGQVSSKFFGFFFGFRLQFSTPADRPEKENRGTVEPARNSSFALHSFTTKFSTPSWTKPGKQPRQLQQNFLRSWVDSNF